MLQNALSASLVKMNFAWGLCHWVENIIRRNFTLTYNRDSDILKAICDDERPILPNILHITREYLDVVKALRDGK